MTQALHEQKRVDMKLQGSLLLVWPKMNLSADAFYAFKKKKLKRENGLWALSIDILLLTWWKQPIHEYLKLDNC